MTRRRAAEREAPGAGSAPVAGDRQPAGGDAAAAPDAAPAVAGLDGSESATVRSGEDSRRRGWYWHWNELVTQYAPLIGLKGVGLLNSYTVWTDRREASPHRGYAFPSQQSEADFYGEDRAELIAINKILVALDLIEIRKEMVLRTDPQGRRWRVPHNFYRVKDHPDGFTISTREALKVAALADRDKAVYRYVRRAFSPRFAPIDGDNPWHRILPELRQTELWQRLAARAAKEEDRASARTRAGHAARRAPGTAVSANEGTGTPDAADFGVPMGDDAAAPAADENDSPAVAMGTGMGTSVATTNRGSRSAVAGTNNGSTPPGPSIVATANGGAPTAVDPTNRTYNQDELTTTTNGRRDPRTEVRATPAATAAAPPTPPPAVGVGAGGPAPARPANAAAPAAPEDQNQETATYRAFEAANDRPSTPAERNLLRGLAARFDLAALAAAELDPAAPESGWEWVTAAVYEAVEAGSAFVAPRRLREILTRWEREGYPRTTDGSEVGGRRSEGSAAADRTADRDPVGRGAARPGSLPRPSALRSSDLRPPTSDPRPPDLVLPHGHGSRRTWEFVVGSLAASLGREALAELVAGTAIVGYKDGEVTLSAPDPAQAERLATTHRPLIERKLAEAMRRPVRLAVVTGSEGPGSEVGGRRSEEREPVLPVAPASPVPTTLPNRRPTAASVPPTPLFVVAECGLPSDQVWAAALAEVETEDGMSRATFDAWLRGTLLLGRGGAGGPGSPLVVGAPHALAQRCLAERFLPTLRRALAAVTGADLPLEIAVTGQWQPPSPTSEPFPSEPPSPHRASG